MFNFLNKFRRLTTIVELPSTMCAGSAKNHAQGPLFDRGGINATDNYSTT